MISIRSSHWFFAFILVITLLTGCAGQTPAAPTALPTAPATATPTPVPYVDISKPVKVDGAELKFIQATDDTSLYDSGPFAVQHADDVTVLHVEAEIVSGDIDLETFQDGVALIDEKGEDLAMISYSVEKPFWEFLVPITSKSFILQLPDGQMVKLDPILNLLAIGSSQNAVNTPIPSTPEPSTLIQLGPGKFGNPMWVDVLKGDFVLTSGSTLRTGSSIGLAEDWMTFPPGLAIDVVGTTVTLMGTTFPDGSKLLVDSSGNLVPRDGADSAAAAAEPTSAPAAEPTAIPAVMKKDIFPTVFLSEPFDENTGQWPVGDVEGQWWTGTRLIKNGVLDWDGKSNTNMNSTVSPDSFILQNSCTSQELNVRVKALNPAMGGSFGLRLMSPDESLSYAFLVDPNGYFAFFLIIEDSWTPLIDWDISPFVNVGDWNKLSIQAEGTHFKLFINDNLVGEADDSTLPSRQAGLIITANEEGERIQIQFDDFEIRLPATQQAAGCPLEISSEKDDRFTEVLVSDSFDDNSKGWPLGDVLTDYWKANRSIKNGVLTIKGKSITDMYAYAYTENGNPWDKEVGDQRVSVKTRLINPPLKGPYGLILRINENLHSTDFYVFFIDSDGWCAFYKTHKNEWTALVDWKEIDFLTPEGWNELAVEAVGGHFRLFINDTLVGEADDNTLAEGRTGLYVETDEGNVELEIQFDDFKILLPKD
ncbi:MAG: hypothetical protein AB9891_01555 [Anaerolineaceae bacterium]